MVYLLLGMQVYLAADVIVQRCHVTTIMMVLATVALATMTNVVRLLLKLVGCGMLGHQHLDGRHDSRRRDEPIAPSVISAQQIG